MTWSRWIGSAACLAGVALLTGALSCSGTQNAATESGTSTASAEDRLERGRRIAWFAGCNDCHTPGALYGAPDTTRLLSGSDLGWQGPWGVTYARNLTPDSTGLAGWTEEQIVTAFTEGRRPDGSPVLPPMPWPNFAHMTREDAFALAAYLKSLPPVPHRAPDRVPPGGIPTTPVIPFPPPPAWDAQNLPPPAAAPVSGGATSGGSASGH